MDKVKRRQEEEIKTKDERLKQGENDRKMVINNITSIEERIEDKKPAQAQSTTKAQRPRKATKRIW